MKALLYVIFIAIILISRLEFTVTDESGNSTTYNSYNEAKNSIDQEYEEEFDYYDGEVLIDNLQFYTPDGYNLYTLGSLVILDKHTNKNMYDYIQIEIPVMKNGRHYATALANTTNISKGVQWDFQGLCTNGTISQLNLDEYSINFDGITVTKY